MGKARQGRRSKATASSRRARAAPHAKTAAEPPLAELRRRATQRLRHIACLLAVVRAEYLAAVAECERLHAARPGGELQFALDGEAGERLAGQLALLRGKLGQVESALIAAQDRNRELQARLALLENGRGRDAGQGARGRADLASVGGEPSVMRPAAGRSGLPLQEEMANLLRFLDELTAALPSQASSVSPD